MQFFFTYGPYILTPLHILVCLVLIAVVLLQTGKGADFASALGGGTSQTAFGPRGVENTLSRLTKIAAIVFMLTSLSLSLAKTGKGGGALRSLVGEEGVVKKSTPSPTPGAPGAAKSLGATSAEGTSGAAATASPAAAVGLEAAPAAAVEPEASQVVPDAASSPAAGK